MSVQLSPDVVVYVCHHSIPAGTALPRQWTKNGVQVVLHAVPCSGKIDAQYILHAFEGGVRGLCVVGCPKGECHLSQGNYRAEIRVHTVRRLLNEVGMEPERAELLHASPNDSPERYLQALEEAVTRLCGLSESPISAAQQAVAS